MLGADAVGEERIAHLPLISPIHQVSQGTVLASGNSEDNLLNKRVFIVPMQGWKSAPDAPESQYASMHFFSNCPSKACNSRLGILGGVKYPPVGVFSEFVKIARDQVIETPEYLDDHHAAAWPLAGVTAWR